MGCLIRAYREGMSRIIRIARHLIEPAAGATFFALWILAEAGRMSLPVLGEHNLSWIATLALLSTGVALVRVLPVVSLVLPGVLLLAQLFLPAARFTENSWPAYLGVALIGVGLVVYAPVPLRRRSYAVLGGYAVVISALLTVPWFGPLVGRSVPYGPAETVRGFVTMLGIAAVTAGFTWVVGTVIRVLSDQKDDAAVPSPSVAALSERENEVFLLAARGLSNAEIASRAFISEATVKSHMSHILAKLGLVSRAQLVAYAWENELVAR